ncbi:MAG: acyl-CoA dehydrogenase family protein [Acidimicrobiia bacterium]
MDIGDTPDEAAFRLEARAWLSDHATLRSTATAASSGHHGDLAAHVAACKAWQATLHAQGWAGITWPVQFGGRGAGPVHAAIFAEEQARFDVAVGAFAVSIGMVGPTLMAHGSPDQQRHLDAMLRGDEVWCQLFSEPGAGSDLASLGTLAVRDGDTYIVNGQKVWTSLGQFADFGILLARTDPEQPKHRGISYFLVDMRSPGIDVRPLKQITGIAHFNEVFLTDVRIPATNLVGVEGEGWRVAQTTLSNERAFIGSGGGAWTVEQLIDLARRRGVAGDPRIRQELAKAHCRSEVLGYLGYRMRTAMSRGVMPGPEMFTMKLASANHWSATTDLATRILGPDGTLWAADAPEDGRWQQHHLGQFAIRIGGGTDEVQHNIIGERGLGLPREPHTDKDVPWSELVRA